MTKRIRRDRLPQCSLASCPDLRRTLAKLGGWRRISLPLIPTTEEIQPSRAPHQSRRRRTGGRAAGRGDQSLSCRCDAALCARQEPERQRLTGWQSFDSSVTGIAGLCSTRSCSQPSPARPKAPDAGVSPHLNLPTIFPAIVAIMRRARPDQTLAD